MACGEPKHHWAALQVEALRGPSQTNQPKKHQGRCERGNLIQPAAGSHADRRLHENCRSGRHANPATSFAQNCSRAQKTNSLNDIGGDAGAPRIPEQARDFAGKDREERRCEADKAARAHTCRPTPQVALDANDGAQHSYHRQSQKDFTKREHALAPQRLCVILSAYNLNCVNFAKWRALACISPRLRCRSRSNPNFSTAKLPNTEP